VDSVFSCTLLYENFSFLGSSLHPEIKIIIEKKVINLFIFMCLGCEVTIHKFKKK
jgi:hypothetical protein